MLFPVAPLPPQYNLLLPLNVWGWIWLSAGVILFQQAFVRVDRIGYVVAVVLKFAWATVAVYDWLYTYPDPRGWVSAVIWYAFGTLTAIVANWPEHTMPKVEVFNGDDE